MIQSLRGRLIGMIICFSLSFGVQLAAADSFHDIEAPEKKSSEPAKAQDKEKRPVDDAKSSAFKPVQVVTSISLADLEHLQPLGEIACEKFPGWSSNVAKAVKECQFDLIRKAHQLGADVIGLLPVSISDEHWDRLIMAATAYRKKN